MIFVIIYLFTLYIRPQDWHPLFIGWHVDYLVIIPALLFGVASKLNRQKLIAIPQYKLLFILLAIIFLSNAVNGYVSFGYEQFVLFFKKICIFIMFLWIVNKTKNLKNVMFVMITLSVFIAIQAIIQYFSGETGFAGQDFYRSGVGVRTKWVGLWNGANILALLFNISIPFALEFAFNRLYSIFFRFINLIMALCLITGVYTTNSRGGFITLLVILLLYSLFKVRKKKIAIILGLLLVAVMFFGFAPTRSSEIGIHASTAHSRTQIWDNAKDLFAMNKILGIGKGRFEQTGRRMEAHSNFMQNLAEIGGFGIFVWVALIYFTFKGLYYVYQLKPPPDGKGLLLKSLSRALLVSLIGFNVCTLFITMEIDIFYLLLGLCVAAINIINREICPIEMKFTLPDARNICVIIILLLSGYHLLTIL